MLLAAPLPWIGCGRPKGTAFPGFAFVANFEGRSVAVVDLSAFACRKLIPIDGRPTGVVNDPLRPAVYVLTPETGTLHEITLERMAVARRNRLASSIVSVRMAPEGNKLWILCHEPRMLAGFEAGKWQVTARIALPYAASDFDLSRDGRWAVVSSSERSEIAFLDLERGKVVASVEVRTKPGLVRFRSDGRVILVGSSSERLLTVVDFRQRAVATRLPLALIPEHYAVTPDGGQVFLSGPGMDAVAIVFPYTMEVAETVLAGRGPAAMTVALDPPYLLVANPATNDVTILEVETRRVLGVVAVGKEPRFIAITSDNQYALVLSQGSGDLAVIRLAAIAGKRTRQAPLFTLIPVGSRPVSLAVRQM